jgi:uncharacterized protein (DUF2062 family)
MSTAKSPRFKGARAALENYLAAGASAEKLALAVALGITCGLFPVFGTTTALAALAALAFRVNLIVVQLFNYLMYPIYFPCVAGFIMAGAWAFGDGLDHYSIATLQHIAAMGWRAALQTLGADLLHAIYAWLVFAPFCVLVLRACMLPSIRRWTVSRKQLTVPSDGSGS